MQIDGKEKFYLEERSDLMSVRMATEQDLPRILEIYGYYVENTAITFEYTIPTLEEFTERFLGIIAQFPWLVWEENGKVLGYAYGSRTFPRAAYQWCASASVYLSVDSCGQGIGKKLYAALEDLLRRQGYKKVYATITEGNESSIAFHQAAGYRHIATLPNSGYKFGKWYGVHWLEKELNTWDTPPCAPIPIHRLLVK